MSKAAKSARSMKRKKEKHSKKAAKAATYKSYAEKGKEVGSKRARKHKVISMAKGQHLMDNCGNPGCKKCHTKLVRYV